MFYDHQNVYWYYERWENSHCCHGPDAFIVEEEVDLDQIPSRLWQNYVLSGFLPNLNNFCFYTYLL